MTEKLVDTEAPSPTETHTQAAETIRQLVGQGCRTEPEPSKGGIYNMYNWGTSSAGRKVTCALPKDVESIGPQPVFVQVDDPSKQMRRALRAGLPGLSFDAARVFFVFPPNQQPHLITEHDVHITPPPANVLHILESGGLGETVGRARQMARSALHIVSDHDHLGVVMARNDVFREEDVL